MALFQSANPFDQLSPVVRRLVVANVIVFLLQMILPVDFVLTLGLTPRLVLEKFWVWQVFTYAFLHGNGWHLFFNMFALWMCGPAVESRWGSRQFFLYYILCGLGAALAQFALAPAHLVVGASGAIYGLLLAFAFLYPDAIMYLFFIFPVRAMQAVLFIALMTLASAISSGGSRVAHFAHLGGLVTGFLYFKLPEWRDRFRLWRSARLFQSPKGPSRKIRQNAVDLSGEVDRILDKISTQGVDSLTEKEHEIMKKYAEQKK